VSATFAIWTRIVQEKRKSGGTWPATDWGVVDEGLSEDLARMRAASRQGISNVHGLSMEYVVLPHGQHP
jgi:hypothetical protein